MLFSSHAPDQKNGRKYPWRDVSSFRAPPGSPPSRAAISNRLFGLTHFNLARGIRCDRALPPSVKHCYRPHSWSMLRSRRDRGAEFFAAWGLIGTAKSGKKAQAELTAA